MPCPATNTVLGNPKIPSGSSKICMRRFREIDHRTTGECVFNGEYALCKHYKPSSRRTPTRGRPHNGGVGGLGGGKFESEFRAYKMFTIFLGVGGVVLCLSGREHMVVYED